MGFSVTTAIGIAADRSRQLGGNRPDARDTQDLPLRRIEVVSRFQLRKRRIWSVKHGVEFPRSIAQRDSKCLHS